MGIVVYNINGCEIYMNRFEYANWENMPFNYAKLNGKIAEKFRTRAAFAEAIGMTASSLSLKLNNKAQFSQYEIFNACALLDINAEDIHFYFFTPKEA